MTKTTTAALSDFVSKTEAVPVLVAERAKLHIADTLACIFAGTSSEAVERFTRTVAPCEDSGQFVVPGLGRWTDPALAAMLIGLCAHADDFDDTSEYSMNGHPSAPIVSALISMACKLNSSGIDVIRAYAVGIEVACKLGLAVGEAHTRRGWHTMSTLGTLGATAAVANLSGLDAVQTECALGIATSFAGGLLGNTGTMTKALHCGRAAQAAYLAVALAQEGFTAGVGILESKSGFLDVFTDGSHPSPELPPLGTNWELLAPGLAVKLYPCCSCTHLAIDGARRILHLKNFDLTQIKTVVCAVREECTHYLRFPSPENGIEAKFSMNYAVAVALLRGNVVLEDFDEGGIARHDIAALMPKVQMVVPEDSAGEGTVEVLLKDGGRFSVTNKVPRGSPGDPADWDDIIAKMHGTLGRAKRLPPKALDKLISGVQQMEKLDGFTALFAT